MPAASLAEDEKLVVEPSGVVEHFPDAVQIVDRFHANLHLSDVAKSIYGAGTDPSKQWAHERYDELTMETSTP